MAEHCMGVRFIQLWWGTAIWNTKISQSSVATRLWCGGIFNYCFAINLLLSLPVNELWKSVSI